MNGVPDRRAGAAFTLVETMVAIGLLALVIGSVSGFLFSLFDQRDALKRAINGSSAADRMFERIEDDLLAVVASDAQGGSGIRGTATSLTVLTRGVWLDQAALDGDGQPWRHDLQRTEYHWDATTGRITMRRTPIGRGAPTGSTGGVLTERAERVRFRYYDGRYWSDSFDTVAKGELPAAVEVSLWLAPASHDRPRLGAESDGPAAPASEEPGERELDDRPESAPFIEAVPAAQLERAPDRFRIILIPDGGSAGWTGGAP